jgi:hypothetical protein
LISHSQGATQLVAQRVYGGAQEIMQSVSASSSSSSSSSSHDDDGASSAAKTGPFSDKHIHLSAPPKPPKSEEAAGMDAEDAGAVMPTACGSEINVSLNQ